MIPSKIQHTLEKVKDKNSPICFLTGAGISAESGIRTFRGEDGYWTVGSDVYTPQEMATLRMFRQNPDECWHWYLNRFLSCKNAIPNSGHSALVELEKKISKQFSLITQNIDALHLKAGSTEHNTFQIHGSIRHMRCSLECTNDIFPLSIDEEELAKNQINTAISKLLCPYCGATARPHVLWFDECYNEIHYRADSAMNRAIHSDLLIIVGTTLLTSLPAMIVDYFKNTHKPIITIDIHEGNSSQVAENSPNGGFLQGPSSELLPELTALLT